MLSGAAELRASEPFGACDASGSAVPAAAFAAADAWPKPHASEGVARARRLDLWVAR